MGAVYRGFDFFASGELPAPPLSESEAGTVGTDMLGRPVTARWAASRTPTSCSKTTSAARWGC
jgi:hypothetical protein